MVICERALKVEESFTITRPAGLANRMARVLWPLTQAVPNSKFPLPESPEMGRGFSGWQDYSGCPYSKNPVIRSIRVPF